jgi:hypothetical protein
MTLSLDYRFVLLGFLAGVLVVAGLDRSRSA